MSLRPISSLRSVTGADVERPIGRVDGERDHAVRRPLDGERGGLTSRCGENCRQSAWCCQQREGAGVVGQDPAPGVSGRRRKHGCGMPLEPRFAGDRGADLVAGLDDRGSRRSHERLGITEAVAHECPQGGARVPMQVGVHRGADDE